MWINRERFLDLVKRVENLEQAARQRNNHAVMADNAQPAPKAQEMVAYGRLAGMPAPAGWWSNPESWGVVGQSVSVSVLVARMAEYLGFKMTEPTKGGLVDPPKLWVDIHDRTPEPPKTIRIRTGNKTRIKQEKRA